MKNFIEKLIERLEERQNDIAGNLSLNVYYSDGYDKGIEYAIEIVNELAEEYKNTNIITDFLQYARDNADNYDTNDGWSLADLIDLSIKYSQKTINTSTDISTTNADRIRSMTDEELAEFLVNFKNTFGEEYEDEMSCLDWLHSEVGGGADD